MPIYEYRCENGHTFEAFQSMSEEALDGCEVCDASASRVLSAPAVHFKGSGFYTTDYARKGAKEGAGEDGSGSSSTTKDSKGSKDSKSEGKSSDGGSKSSEKASTGSSSKASSD